MTHAADLRVGLVGYGLAGEYFHAPLVAAVAGLRLDAIVTSDAGRAARAAARFPEATVVADADALFARDLDVIVVATPNRTHAPLAQRAVDAGLAVVVDKPMAASADAARRLAASAEDRGVVLTVFHNRRWDGDFLTVRDLLDGARLGQVARFESRFERWRPAIKAGWREHPGLGDAGGVLWDLGPHLVDQALQLFGPVRAVYAEMDLRRPGAQVDDDSFMALTHVSGVRSHLWMSATAPQAGPRFRLLGDHGGFTKWGIDGQEAALRAGAVPGDGWGRDPEATWGRLGVDGGTEAVETCAGAYPDFYAGVVAAVRDGAPPPVAPGDAVAGLEIIEAARRSAGSGQEVALT
ncbi:Gfo/Idh/MocA family oxidoreductase [Acidiferrimicrobium sp. IK]|uniref:Gfo/Idh/MocA family protein n=1 Tax=Acidiferrimicrobium sp. IK TaxID=2871700 RepID=UPI0021CB2979|nr:Gfo/Idh/MocA family oxidoreductase [Acidiferrimicrobium sp. IK]MCU4184979.1 Gfo/Idh/MocA family oxidoreductase [Acidiferrimicrobium sp. IK]